MKLIISTVISILAVVVFLSLLTDKNFNQDLFLDYKIDKIYSKQINKDSNLIDTLGYTIKTRYKLPKGFKRTYVKPKSYGDFLQKLPLKSQNEKVKYYDNTIKSNDNIYCGVINLKIGNKNLHQCADAVMRLCAEYLWKHKRYEEIHFNLTNGFRVDYSEWMKGKRIIVKENNSFWKSVTSPSNTKEDFWDYMELIFMYAGTLSLSKELRLVNISNMKIGDIFIKGGYPGHAIVIVDMAENTLTKEKIFILAQSYMPAQEIQILVNKENPNYSPWYFSNFENKLYTPEWTFYRNQLMRFY